jgi:hypothetical protein
MRTANIASALFVIGLLISGNLTGAGVQPSNLVLANVVSLPASALIAEIYIPEAAAALLETGDNKAVFKTLRIAIDAKDGLQSRICVINSTTAALSKAQPGQTYNSASSSLPLNQVLIPAQRPTTAGETYLDGQQVAHSLFRYDSVKAPDIPRNI